jgi:hypothetical protein
LLTFLEEVPPPVLNVIHTIEGRKEARALAALGVESCILDPFMRVLDDAVEAADAAAEAGEPIPTSRWERARIAWTQEQAVQRQKKRAGRKLRIVR